MRRRCEWRAGPVRTTVDPARPPQACSQPPPGSPERTVSPAQMRDRPSYRVLIVCWGLGWPSFGARARVLDVPDGHHNSVRRSGSVTPVFTNTERLALAGFLAGYSGLTRQAYELDLRQFASWCQQHQLHLFGARRADIEFFARDLEACGRARANRPVSLAAELWRQEAWLSPWVLPASGRARRQAGGSPSRRRPRGRTMPAGWPAGAGCG